MLNVLHVERSGFIKKVVKNLMFNQGHTYFSVNSYQEVPETIAVYDIDVLLSSAVAGKEPFESFVVSCKNENPSIKIVVLTSNDNQSERDKIMALGAYAYINKKDLHAKLPGILAGLDR